MSIRKEDFGRRTLLWFSGALIWIIIVLVFLNHIRELPIVLVIFISVLLHFYFCLLMFDVYYIQSSMIKEIFGKKENEKIFRLQEERERIHPDKEILDEEVES